MGRFSYAAFQSNIKLLGSILLEQKGDDPPK